MHVIRARNVSSALAQALPYLIENGVREDSRNGVVLVAPEPVCTVYDLPCERVLFSATRDANPFFHLMESLWMLAGRNDVQFTATFNSRFIEYSDDGVTIHGAYGHRWRKWFGMDQLSKLIAELRANPKSRRAVLQMWSPHWDLVSKPTYDGNSVGGLGSKDVPCNTTAYFDLRDGVLNMTVLNRSNDVIWGAYGANAVHFSILQEYMAANIGVEVGTYRQVSNNFHVYTDVYSISKLQNIADEARDGDYYTDNTVPFKMIDDIGEWEYDLQNFFNMYDHGLKVDFITPFFKGVAVPMFRAYMDRKHMTGDGRKYVEQIIAEDWKLACTQWIDRRQGK